jgi:hypothetical protein
MAGFACQMPSLIQTAAVPGRFCPSDNPAFETLGRSTPPKPGDWAGVIAQIEVALRDFAHPIAA